MSAVSRSVLLATVAAVGVGGFALGRWSSRPASVRLAAAAPTGVAVQKTASASALATSVAPNSPTERAAALAKAVAAAPASLAGEEERERQIEEWAKLDPKAAMDFARSQLKGDRRAQAMAAVITEWGKKNPAEAWQWVEKEMPNATNYYDTLLETFGRGSTATAAQYAAQYAAAHPESSLEVHLAALLGVTYRGDFAGARALVDGDTNLAPDVRANLENFIAGQWGRFAPDEASQWVMSLPEGQMRDQALIGLGESWSDVDPAAAAKFAVDLPEGNARTLALRQAIGKWVATDADSARAWVINSNHHEDFDQAVQTIATDPNLLNRQPARAMLWAQTIFDDRLRAQSMGVILQNWYPMDPNGAVNYIKSAPNLSADERTALLQKLPARNGAGS